MYVNGPAIKVLSSLICNITSGIISWGFFTHSDYVATVYALSCVCQDHEQVQCFCS